MDWLIFVLNYLHELFSELRNQAIFNMANPSKYLWNFNLYWFLFFLQALKELYKQKVYHLKVDKSLHKVSDSIWVLNFFLEYITKQYISILNSDLNTIYFPILSRNAQWFYFLFVKSSPNECFRDFNNLIIPSNNDHWEVFVPTQYNKFINDLCFFPRKEEEWHL